METIIVFIILSIFFTSILMYIILYSIFKNNPKVHTIISNIFITIVVIFMLLFLLFGAIIFPFYILKSILGNDGIFFTLFFVFIVWFIISLLIHFKNRFIIRKHNGKEIYIRDITVDYSPAVTSYLMNNKIEVKKDLPATLLNLCANNILKLEKDENNKINIIDLKNDIEVNKLKEDEKYAYQMFITKITPSKIKTWKRKVTEEFENYKFSKPQKKILPEYFTSLYMLVFFIFFVSALIFTIFDIEITENIGNLFGYILIIVFFAAWESGFIMMIKAFITNSEKSFIDTYTRKGALEYNKWKKFEKFMVDFTLIKEKKYENIVLLGKYLSYSIALNINKKCDKELYKNINKNYSFDFESISNLFEENEKTIDL